MTIFKWKTVSSDKIKALLIVDETILILLFKWIDSCLSWMLDGWKLSEPSKKLSENIPYKWFSKIYYNYINPNIIKC